MFSLHHCSGGRDRGPRSLITWSLLHSSPNELLHQVGTSAGLGTPPQHATADSDERAIRPSDHSSLTTQRGPLIKASVAAPCLLMPAWRPPPPPNFISSALTWRSAGEEQNPAWMQQQRDPETSPPAAGDEQPPPALPCEGWLSVHVAGEEMLDWQRQPGLIDPGPR